MPVGSAVVDWAAQDYVWTLQPLLPAGDAPERPKSGSSCAPSPRFSFDQEFVDKLHYAEAARLKLQPWCEQVAGAVRALLHRIAERLRARVELCAGQTFEAGARAVYINPSEQPGHRVLKWLSSNTGVAQPNAEQVLTSTYFEQWAFVDLYLGEVRATPAAEALEAAQPLYRRHTVHMVHVDEQGDVPTCYFSVDAADKGNELRELNGTLDMAAPEGACAKLPATALLTTALDRCSGVVYAIVVTCTALAPGTELIVDYSYEDRSWASAEGRQMRAKRKAEQDTARQVKVKLEPLEHKELQQQQEQLSEPAAAPAASVSAAGKAAPHSAVAAATLAAGFRMSVHAGHGSCASAAVSTAGVQDGPVAPPLQQQQQQQQQQQHQKRHMQPAAPAAQAGHGSAGQSSDSDEEMEEAEDQQYDAGSDSDGAMSDFSDGGSLDSEDDWSGSELHNDEQQGPDSDWEMEEGETQQSGAGHQGSSRTSSSSRSFTYWWWQLGGQPQAQHCSRSSSGAAAAATDAAAAGGDVAGFIGVWHDPRPSRAALPWAAAVRVPGHVKGPWAGSVCSTYHATAAQAAQRVDAARLALQQLPGALNFPARCNACEQGGEVREAAAALELQWPGIMAAVQAAAAGGPCGSSLLAAASLDAAAAIAAAAPAGSSCGAEAAGTVSSSSHGLQSVDGQPSVYFLVPRKLLSRPLNQRWLSQGFAAGQEAAACCAYDLLCMALLQSPKNHPASSYTEQQVHGAAAALEQQFPGICEAAAAAAVAAPPREVFKQAAIGAAADMAQEGSVVDSCNRMGVYKGLGRSWLMVMCVPAAFSGDGKTSSLSLAFPSQLAAAHAHNMCRQALKMVRQHQLSRPPSEAEVQAAADLLEARQPGVLDAAAAWARMRRMIWQVKSKSVQRAAALAPFLEAGRLVAAALLGEGSGSSRESRESRDQAAVCSSDAAGVSRGSGSGFVGVKGPRPGRNRQGYTVQFWLPDRVTAEASQHHSKQCEIYSCCGTGAEAAVIVDLLRLALGLRSKNHPATSYSTATVHGAVQEAVGRAKTALEEMFPGICAAADRVAAAAAATPAHAFIAAASTAAGLLPAEVVAASHSVTECAIGVTSIAAVDGGEDSSSVVPGAAAQAADKGPGGRITGSCGNNSSNTRRFTGSIKGGRGILYSIPAAVFPAGMSVQGQCTMSLCGFPSAVAAACGYDLCCLATGRLAVNFDVPGLYTPPQIAAAAAQLNSHYKRRWNVDDICSAAAAAAEPSAAQVEAGRALAAAAASAAGRVVHPSGNDPDTFGGVKSQVSSWRVLVRVPSGMMKGSREQRSFSQSFSSSRSAACAADLLLLSMGKATLNFPSSSYQPDEVAAAQAALEAKFGAGEISWPAAAEVAAAEAAAEVEASRVFKAAAADAAGRVVHPSGNDPVKFRGVSSTGPGSWQVHLFVPCKMMAGDKRQRGYDKHFNCSRSAACAADLLRLALGLPPHNFAGSSYQPDEVAAANAALETKFGAGRISWPTEAAQAAEAATAQANADRAFTTAVAAAAGRMSHLVSNGSAIIQGVAPNTSGYNRIQVTVPLRMMEGTTESERTLCRSYSSSLSAACAHDLLLLALGKVPRSFPSSSYQQDEVAAAQEALETKFGAGRITWPSAAAAASAAAASQADSVFKATAAEAAGRMAHPGGTQPEKFEGVTAGRPGKWLAYVTIHAVEGSSKQRKYTRSFSSSLSAACAVDLLQLALGQRQRNFCSSYQPVEVAAAKAALEAHFGPGTISWPATVDPATAAANAAAAAADAATAARAAAEDAEAHRLLAAAAADAAGRVAPPGSIGREKFKGVRSKPSGRGDVTMTVPLGMMEGSSKERTYHTSFSNSTIAACAVDLLLLALGLVPRNFPAISYHQGEVAAAEAALEARCGAGKITWPAATAAAADGKGAAVQATVPTAAAPAGTGVDAAAAAAGSRQKKQE